MNIRSVVLLALLTGTGTALAQTPAAPPAQPHAQHQWKGAAAWHQKMEQQRLDRMAVLLDLTPAQRQQVQAILSEEHARMNTAMQQVEQAMKQARATHRAVRKDTEQKLAGVLSPTQMKKLEALMPEHGMMMHEMMMRGMMHGMGPGMGHGMHHGMDHGMDHGDMSKGAPPPGDGPGPQ